MFSINVRISICRVDLDGTCLPEVYQPLGPTQDKRIQVRVCARDASIPPRTLRDFQPTSEHILVGG